MARFTATHGVSFGDLGIKFTFDAEATGQKQTKVYAADLTAAQSKKLLAIGQDKLDAYGIKQADAPAKADADAAGDSAAS